MKANEKVYKSPFLTLSQVLQLIPISRSTLYLGISKGIYPAPVKLGRRRVAWRNEDIAKLMKSFEPSPDAYYNQLEKE